MLTPRYAGVAFHAIELNGRQRLMAPLADAVHQGRHAHPLLVCPELLVQLEELGVELPRPAPIARPADPGAPP